VRRSAVLGIAFLGVLGRPVGAQQTGKMYRVGILSGRRLAAERLNLDAFRRKLSSLGYESIPNLRADGILVLQDPVTLSNVARVVRPVAAQRLPAVYSSVPFTAAGGLMSYGASEVAIWNLTATFVDRILKGANPADLPVERPTKFEFVVNLKTARDLGITFPQSILLRADQIIR